MANKFETSSYYVKVYDKYGTKQHEEYNIESLTEAKVLGEHLTSNSTESFVVSRVIFNSLDDRTVW